ncbi:hypothetical protein KsCSTR_21340 [Candidatus Kuenenia stuttgartiensis]|uniref:Uncharacterized protein n=1 Tax=Kuenenia stuttgartiensis TaxID=174633 RepID=Q1Q312_KUEST|nr:hypothetical protein KsCSTR_21340 [Candidatus Kuenenia stuttgartiensis]CAJ74406.1 unknown protein [Candidatus Kuenenia stuttgartiensis]
MFFVINIPPNTLEILPFQSYSCNKALPCLQDLGNTLKVPYPKEANIQTHSAFSLKPIVFSTFHQRILCTETVAIQRNLLNYLRSEHNSFPNRYFTVFNIPLTTA